MIPKIIHYCWFGRNPLPPLALECIASWRKYLPDYEIWMWVESEDESGETRGERLESEEERREVGDEGIEVCVADRVMGFDVNSISYTAEAYKHKKYAFVSDYARFWVMYKYGGIYFDTDVEVLRPLDELISSLSSQDSRPFGFMGFEVDPDGENTPGKFAPRYGFAVNPGLGFGMEKGHPFMMRMLDVYSDLKYIPISGDVAWYKTIVAYTTDQLCEMGLKNIKGIQNVLGITIYPHEYFAPINVISGRLHVTKNTYTIHRYMGSWDANKDNSLKGRLKSVLPEYFFVIINKIKRRRYRIK